MDVASRQPWGRGARPAASNASVMLVSVECIAVFSQNPGSLARQVHFPPSGRTTSRIRCVKVCLYSFAVLRLLLIDEVAATPPSSGVKMRSHRDAPECNCRELVHGTHRFLRPWPGSSACATGNAVASNMGFMPHAARCTVLLDLLGCMYETPQRRRGRSYVEALTATSPTVFLNFARL